MNADTNLPVGMLINSLPDPAIATDTDGRIFACNQAAEALYGWSEDEAAGTSFVEMIVAPDGREAFAQIDHHGHWTAEVTLRRRDGGEFAALVKRLPFADESGSAGAVWLSSRPQEADHVRQQNAAATADSVPALLARARRDGEQRLRWGYMNRHWEAYARVNPVLQGHAPVNGPPDTKPGVPTLLELMEAGAQMPRLLRLRGADGNSRWFRFQASFSRDDDGHIEHAEVLATDVHDEGELRPAERRTEADISRLVDELQRADTATDEALELLSHELRTPLMVLLGYAYRLNSRADDFDEETRAMHAALLDSARSVRLLVNNALILSRRDAASAEIGPLLLQRQIERTVRHIRDDQPERAIEVALPAELPPVAANADWLELVLENLIALARTRQEEGARIAITAWQAREEVVVEVGEYETAANRRRRARTLEPLSDDAGLFGPGLSLATCKRLIEWQRGTIAVSEGEGRDFHLEFRLPAILEEPASS